LHKGEYRDKDAPKTGYQWVMRCFNRPKYFYKMFRMSPDVFMVFHNLLVSSYDLKSTHNVTSIESLAMFLWIVGGPQSFSQAENSFVCSTWTIHMKFNEVLKCCVSWGKKISNLRTQHLALNMKRSEKIVFDLISKVLLVL
jgi:hypothetical protein